jgi:hypothetical protein
VLLSLTTRLKVGAAPPRSPALTVTVRLFPQTPSFDAAKTKDVADEPAFCVPRIVPVAGAELAPITRDTYAVRPPFAK